MAESRLIASLILLLMGCSFAVRVVAPVDMDVGEGDIIDLGTIGPGQTISVLINPKVETGGVHGIGGYYDMAEATTLPAGWSSGKSKMYGNPLQVTVSAAPDAPEGDYSTKITVVDEMNGEQLGNITFTAWVHVTWDVLDMDVSPSYLAVGPGQPAKFDVTVSNKGSASDVFEVSAKGATGEWEFTKQVFVPAGNSKKLSYDIAGYEEETYLSEIKVVSLASANIYEARNVTLFVRPDLLSDYKATNHGTVVFPVFEALIYAFAGIISNLY